jgi:hypothetical protein
VRRHRGGPAAIGSEAVRRRVGPPMFVPIARPGCPRPRLGQAARFRLALAMLAKLRVAACGPLTPSCGAPARHQGGWAKSSGCSAASLAAKLSCLFEASVSGVPDSLLPASEHVVGSQVADGAVQADTVVVVDESFDETTCFLDGAGTLGLMVVTAPVARGYAGGRRTRWITRGRNDTGTPVTVRCVGPLFRCKPLAAFG